MPWDNAVFRFGDTVERSVSIFIIVPLILAVTAGGPVNAQVDNQRRSDVLSVVDQASASNATLTSSAATAHNLPSRWWKGNLHTHSLWSDGDEYAETIIEWYFEQGYNFLALSDHNVLAKGEKWIDVARSAGGMAAYHAYLKRFGNDWVEQKIVDSTLHVRLKTFDEYRGLFEEPGRFLMIQSEEISDWHGDKPVHVNATNVKEVIEPQGGGSVLEVLQNNVDAVLEQRSRTDRPMFPHVNHPNFVWTVTAEDLIALEGDRFFEVYNGHPLVHNYGDSLHPSTERIWDIVLTRRLVLGKPLMYGLAVDDAHNYHDYSSDHSNPGRGWVMVRAPRLSADAIITALEEGDFYATTGVELTNITRSDSLMSIEIAPETGVSYVTQFIGTRSGYEASDSMVTNDPDRRHSRRYSDEIGVVLDEVEGRSPSYKFQGNEIYVRAKIISSKIKTNPYAKGEVESAWVQPVKVAAR